MELKPQTEKELKKELNLALAQVKMKKLIKTNKNTLKTNITNIKNRIAQAQMEGNQEEYDKLINYLIKLEKE